MDTSTIEIFTIIQHRYLGRYKREKWSSQSLPWLKEDHERRRLIVVQEIFLIQGREWVNQLLNSELRGIYFHHFEIHERLKMYSKTLEQAHDIIGLEYDDITLHEFDEGTHRRFDIDHGIMCSLEPFTEQMLVELSKFRWFERKSPSLQLAILSR